MSKDFKMTPAPSLMSDTDIHRLSEFEKAEEMFGHELKQAEAVQAALNRIDRLTHAKPVLDIRDMGEIRYEFKGTFRGVQTWICWDESEGQELIGEGESKKMALVDFLEKRGVEPRPAPRTRTIHHSPFEPPEVGDDRDADFDDGLTDDDAR